ncbi:MAG: gamma-glutamyl-gamma-aminobutyrate hydrolase family protein [Bacteroidales bacterium]|nr:gamma-glutamyl-gamma-aminobutyrate hydrolase family protein [Bacteroidales bacterium]
MKTKYFYRLLIFTVVTTFFLLNSCIENKTPKPLRIAISKAKPIEYYGAYSKWIKNIDSTTICIDMYHIPLDSALLLMNDCAGLLITGGSDVHPAWYGQACDTIKCGTIDLKRDTLEFALIKKALEMNMPMVGICRGEQILNVALGGSLIVDIPIDYDTVVVHRCDDPYNYRHAIFVNNNSLLFELSGTSKGLTNSNHHQAVNKLAGDLKISARTADSLVEAVEWKNPDNKAFLIAVQWHPERLHDTNRLSFPIAEGFINSAREFQKKD